MNRKYTQLITLLCLVPHLLFSDGIERAGDIGQHLIPAAALTYTAAIHDGDGARQFMKMGLITIGTVYALKYSINSKRPKGGGFSFPSGHTASAFIGATYLHQRYGWQYALPAYIGASFVGFSRVHARRHHTIDVVAAAALAYGASRLFIQPFYCEDSAGFCFEHEF